MTFFFAQLAHTQAPNNNIKNCRLLRAEEIIASSTVGCTVQRLSPRP